MPAPKEAIKKLQWWLQKRFRGPFTNCGDALEHGRQDDATECGIVTANTAAREVFHDALWTSNQKNVERVDWFHMLCAAHVNDVRVNTSCTVHNLKSSPSIFK